MFKLPSSIAQVVFDLPLPGYFDYAVPASMQDHIVVGMRVIVPFGRRKMCGIVAVLADQSDVQNLKSIDTLCEPFPSCNPWMMDFARVFAAHYGCSQGEALAAMLPRLLRLGRRIEISLKPEGGVKEEPSKPSVFVTDSLAGAPLLCTQMTQVLTDRRSVLVLVPDTYHLKPMASYLRSYFKETMILVDESTALTDQIAHWLKVRQHAGVIVLGTRSAVFSPVSDLGLAVMIDEGNSSYKQEQSPLYETRDTLLMRAQIQGFDVAFCSIAPSVELWHGLNAGTFRHGAVISPKTVLPQVVDLTNYKFIPGLMSIPVRDVLAKNLMAGKKSALILNRRGSYSVTRCTDCGDALKCVHCDSPLLYSRVAKKFLCRHCTFHLPGDTVCPRCHKPSWKSVRMGIEQLDSELRKSFPQAKIGCFEKENSGELGNFDILIATQALLRFKGMRHMALVALIDMDGELTRMDMRSAYKAWRLARQFGVMAQEQVLVQTRQMDHYVIKSIRANNLEVFYTEDLRLRQEFGFAPFQHWVRVMCRSKNENLALAAATDLYNQIMLSKDQSLAVMEPVADAVAKKRDQYHFHVTAQGAEVMAMMKVIKAAMGQVKRTSRVIVTVNVDP